MKQRIFAILLSLTMIFTLVPTAWAENNGITTEAELRTAIENATGEKNTIPWQKILDLLLRWKFQQISISKFKEMDIPFRLRI